MRVPTDIDESEITSAFGNKFRDKERSDIPKRLPGQEASLSPLGSEPFEYLGSSIELIVQGSRNQTIPMKNGHEGNVEDEVKQDEISGAGVISQFEEIIRSLQSATLTRQEASKVENLLWDVKAELYAAEKRGRENQ